MRARVPVERLLIVPVLVLATCLYLWALGRNDVGNVYYAAAVKSMGESWHAFLFASLDPAGFITVDKPPLSFWPAAILVRIFGLGSWTALLPQALEGVLTVLVLWRIIVRRFGDTAALLAALALTVTPIVVATSRVNLPDTLLTLLLVCAAWATLRGAEDGRIRWLVLAGFFLGAGFMTKTIAAFLVLPALALGYWLASSAPRRHRVLALGAGAVSTVVCSLPWVLLVALTPAADRPWIGGSDDNTALGLAFSRTGFDTFGPIGGGGPRPPGFGQAPGVTRLFNEELAGQASWFLFLAVAGAVIAGWSAWRGRNRGRFGAVVLFAVWLVVHVLVFSFASGVFHAYYLVALAPAVAALVGVGIVAGVELARTGLRGQVIVAAVLAVAVLSQAAILERTPSYLTWLRPLLIALAGLGFALLVAGVARQNGRATRVGMLVVAGALFVAPAVWAIDASGKHAFGSIPVAGPAPQFLGRDFERVTSDGLAAFLADQRSGERWDVAVIDGISAAPLILGGIPVATLGGFLGVDPSGAPGSVANLIERGELRFVLAVSPSFGSSASSAPAAQTVNEVRSACHMANLGEWADEGEALPPENPFAVRWRDVLYDCKGASLG